jgi:hypothetical protein
MVSLPKAIVYPVPSFSTTPGTTNVTISNTDPNPPHNNLPLTAATCTSLGYSAPTCTVSGTTITLDGNAADLTLPNVTVGSGYTLVIKGSNSPTQKININSLDVQGDLTFDYATMDASVIMQFAGLNADGTEMTTAPFNLGDLGSWKQNKPGNANYDAASLQIVYGGTAQITMTGGNSQSAATVYAPNAPFLLKGTQDFYGSILAKTVTNNGNTGIHYDRRLQREFWVAGQPMMGTFTWQRAQ